MVAFIVPSDLGSNVERLKFAAVPLALLAAVARAEAHRAGGRAASRSRASGTSRALARTARAAERRPGAQRGLLAAGDQVPARAPEPVLPGRGGRHDRALAGRLPARRRHSDRARLVPPERLPAERAAVRPQPRGPRRTRPGCAASACASSCITDAPPDYSARGEAALIRSGRSGLVQVFRSPHVKIYELQNASPIVTGQGDANVFWMWPTRMVFSVSQPGRYHVKVRWSPYWHTSQGCVWRGPTGRSRCRRCSRAGRPAASTSTSRAGSRR